jgi:predicted dehydrogenase
MSHPLKIGVVGCGHWGKNLVRNFFQLGCLDAVCDATPANRERAAQIAPRVSTVADVADLLTADIDGVVISTPAETHYALAMQALLAGKDVFVEKPLALTYEQGEALVSEAEQIEYSSEEPLRRECQAFLNAIASRQPARTDGISAPQVLKVLQATQRSLSMNGEPVTLPLDPAGSTRNKDNS